MGVRACVRVRSWGGGRPYLNSSGSGKLPLSDSWN